jgi:hypothetical protein
MYIRGVISILVPALFSEIVAILTAPAVDLESPRGSGFWVGEGRRVTKGDKEGVSLRASGSRGGRVLTQEEGSK